MLKKISLFFICSFSCISLSQTININNVLDVIENNSFEKKSYDIIEKMKNNAKASYELSDFNGVNLNAQYSKNLSDNIDEKFQNLVFKSAVGPFFISFNRNILNDKNNDYIELGFQKNIKDIINSKSKFELKKLENDKKIDAINFNDAINKKKYNVIDIYTELLNLKEELNLKNEAKKTFEKHYKVLSTSFSLGHAKEIDKDATALELQALDIDISIINNKIETLYNIIKNEYGINLNEYELEKIDISNIDFIKDIKYYSQNEIEKAKINANIEKDSLEFEKYNSILPDLNFAFKYKKPINDNKNPNDKEEKILSLNFSKHIFFNDTSLNNSKLMTELKVVELKNIETQVKNAREKLSLEIQSFIENLKLNDKKVEIEYRKYLIKEKEYELGKVSYLDFLSSYNKYLETALKSSTEKNKFNAFVLKNNLKNEVR